MNVLINYLLNTTISIVAMMLVSMIDGCPQWASLVTFILVFNTWCAADYVVRSCARLLEKQRETSLPL